MAVARAVGVLHATDPATVYLSVLARSAASTLTDVSAALYDDRSLLRMMGMRRTLFVVPRELSPTVHHAAASRVAATMRRRLLTELAVAPTDPPLPQDPEELSRWLEDTVATAEQVVARLGVASGAQIGAAAPRLRTAILPRTTKKYDVRRTITSMVLALMGAEGRIVRSRPLGSWTSRQHTWEASTAWWPEGLPPLEEPIARARLVEQYVARFGPVTEADVAWWTGWPLGLTRVALAALPLVETGAGVVLAHDAEPVPDVPPVAALLPALDPTPMGWKDRGWFLPADSRALYDSFGNVGPTVWWAGEVVGGWAVDPGGAIRWRLVEDRGAEAAEAVAAAAARLERRLEGVVVVPSFRTPLERELSAP